MWFFRGKEPEGFKTYKKYRQISNELVTQVMQSAIMGPEWITGAAKEIDILRGKAIELEDESENIAIMDFLLHDYRRDGKTLVETYAATASLENPEQQAVLDGWLRGYTSLFRVAEISAAERTLTLEDLLTAREPIALMDQNMSQSTVSGLLLFTRVFPYERFNMSSGNSFAFDAENEKPLLRKVKSLDQKLKIAHESSRRFVCFFRANRILGLGVGYR